MSLKTKGNKKDENLEITLLLHYLNSISPVKGGKCNEILRRDKGSLNDKRIWNGKRDQLAGSANAVTPLQY